jgi:hypothetical protein
MACRQRHPGGTKELLAQLQRHFKLPSSWLAQLHSAASSTPSAASAGHLLQLPACSKSKGDAATARGRQSRLGMQTWLYLGQVSRMSWFLGDCHVEIVIPLGSRANQHPFMEVTTVE